MHRHFACVLGATAALGCTGEIVGKGTGGGPAATEEALAVGPSGLRRLTRVEYDNALRDLLGDATRPGFAKLPEDVRDPFDNDYKTQLVSGALVESVETLADETVARTLADPARRAMVVPCTPKGPDDAACMRTFITQFGRKALRRPLTDDETARYLALQSFAVEDRNFFTGVSLVLRAMLQDPEFLYQVEIGQPVKGTPGVVRLGDYELASRLSFFLWGTTPSVALLDTAGAGGLVDAEARRAAAATLLADVRGRQRVSWFHALWLGYQQLPFSADLANGLRAESDALVQKIVFDAKGDYFDLFRADQTFLTDTLAAHYGLPSPRSTTGVWTGYGSNPRRGILSHGAVLAVGAKFDDTSPTLRGVFVKNRLLCVEVPPAPPNVDTDQAPAPVMSRCKIERYKAHASGGCAPCHSQIDPVGFGLENYDRAGKYRRTDKDAPECAISGDGDLAGIGKFNGPAGLATMLIATGELEACVARQVYRFATGRRETDQDAPTLARLTSTFKTKGRAFDQLLLDLVASPSYGHRRLEANAP